MTRNLDPVTVLTVRITTRASLYQRGIFNSLDELMQPLYAYAIKHNLFDMFGGVEGIDQMMLDAMTALALPGKTDG